MIIKASSDVILPQSFMSASASYSPRTAIRSAIAASASVIWQSWLRSPFCGISPVHGLVAVVVSFGAGVPEVGAAREIIGIVAVVVYEIVAVKEIAA